MITGPGPRCQPGPTGGAERARAWPLAHDAGVEPEALLPPNFGWLDAGRVAGMGCPRVAELPAVVAEGIGAVLSLTSRPLPPDAEALGLVLRHDPVADFTPPSPEQLLAIVRWMRSQVEAGRAVAVHCMAGLGRTGTVLAAWRVAEGLPPELAIADVRRRRPGSIETRGQEDAIFEFAARWAAAQEGDDA